MKGGLSLATTYLKAHHISGGKSILASMSDRFDYGQNPEKTAVMEVEEEFGIRVHALVTVRDIYEYLQSRADYAHLLPLMEDYMKRYCI